MSHPVWSNIFKKLKRSQSETEIAIQQVPIFENLKRRELKEISKIVHQREFLKDEYVFKFNTPGLGMYIILKGKIAIERIVYAKRIITFSWPMPRYVFY